MLRFTVLSRRFLTGAMAAIVVWASAPAWCSAQGQPAVVEGTDQLFIRRGPGREFPPFATLTGGSQVRLQERHGSWARVTTASGQVGYVHGKFLRLVDEVAAAPIDTAPPATATSAPTSPRPLSTATRSRRNAVPTPTAADAMPTETETPAELTATEVTTAQAAPTSTRTRSPSGSLDIELDRLRDAVEALNRRLDQRFPLPDEGAAPAPAVEQTGASGGAILLGLAGGIIGWFLGSTYQRNKERGRRSRIRL